MAAHRRQQQSSAQWALASLVAVACIAGLPPLVEFVTQSIAEARVDAKKLPGLACRICGVVEDVHEVTPESRKYDVSTVSGEGFAMFLGMLSGKLGVRPSKIYEVDVRLQDGSMRAIREGSLPTWKQGDRVKVVMGRIKPVS
jgi:hypothetical protein